MHNILWLFIDGVRRYHTNDDRSKLKFMDKFAQESIEMKNVMTSAPSTFMSLSAMVSGMPAYYINRNFGDFIFDKKLIPSLTNILSSKGYNIYSFIMHKSTRENMLNIFPMIERKYWPKGLSHGDWWSNSDINRAVENTLRIGVQNPSFFFVDFNCRKDFETSEKVELAFNMFRKAGYTEENTITILCSDHGYPDPSKETGRPEYYIKNNIGHDFVLTDDNIMIPMYIQYPGCEKKLSFDTTVSSIDLFPTLLELLGFDNKIELNIVGKSWVPLFNKNKEYQTLMEGRYHRCDNRFAFQNDKGTVIRNGRYKYIKYHGTKVKVTTDEEFYEINKDPLEKYNLINDEVTELTKEINLFREEFRKNEMVAFNYQVEILLKKILSSKMKYLKGISRVLIMDSSNIMFINMLIQILKRLNEKIKIFILIVEGHKYVKEINGFDKILSIKEIVSYNIAVNSKELYNLISVENIELLLVPYNTTEGRDNKFLRKFVKKVKAPKKLFIDYNMGHYSKTIFNYYIKKFKPMFYFAKHEPKYIFNFLVSNFMKYLKSYKAN